MWTKTLIIVILKQSDLSSHSTELMIVIILFDLVCRLYLFLLTTIRLTITHIEVDYFLDKGNIVDFVLFKF